MLITQRYLNSSLRQYSSGSGHYNSVIPYFSVKNLFSERNNFDEIIDVRTPAEYAEDRLDSAVNIPVLSESEREPIDTLRPYLL